MKTIMHWLKIVGLVLMALCSLPLQSWGQMENSGFTLLVYMNGSNLESRYELATADLCEMQKAMASNETPENFRIVLMLGGTRQWHTDALDLHLPSDSITYALLTSKGVHKLQTRSNQSIGMATTLKDFVTYAQSAFPAENYGLIFWNHGAGSVTGVGYDEWFTDHSLSLSEIREGLSGALSLTVEKRFSFIGFDTCLMATLETAQAVAPFADYMLASQELEPGGGWNYDRVVHRLYAYTPTGAENVMNRIADDYIDTYEDLDQNKLEERMTISVIRLDSIPFLTDAVGNFFDKVNKQLTESRENNQTFFENLSKARLESQSFGIPAFTYCGPDLVDLQNVCERVYMMSNITMDSIYEGLKSSVVYARKSQNMNQIASCGLSLYFPYHNIRTARDLDEYYQCGFHESYLDFIRNYSSSLISGYYQNDNEEVFEPQQYSDSLSTDLIWNTRKIYGVLLRERTDSTWSLYGLEGYGISLDDKGYIVNDNLSENGQWNGNWMKIGDITIAPFMTFSNQDALEYTVPARLNDERVDVLIRYDEEHPYGCVVGARRIIDDLVPDKGLVKVEGHIAFLSPIFQENDSISFSQFEMNGEVYITQENDLQVDIDNVPAGKYRYGYCFVDFYGRKHYMGFKETVIIP